MIDIMPCGHSVETTGRWYRSHPDRCYYCEYLAKHPRPKVIVRNPWGRSGKKKAHSI
jgi:hypothetical protein